MFELNNEQRKYVGLDLILPHWDRVLLVGANTALKAYCTLMAT